MYVFLLLLKTMVSYSYGVLYMIMHNLSTNVLSWCAGHFKIQVVLPGRKLFFPALTVYLKIWCVTTSTCLIFNHDIEHSEYFLVRNRHTLTVEDFKELHIR